MKKVNKIILPHFEDLEGDLRCAIEDDIRKIEEFEEVEIEWG